MPEGQRVYAIGDVHGRLDLLEQLLEMIVADGADYEGKKLLIFLGDYIDRGLKSRGVLDLLSGDMPEGFEAIFLKGNHEQAMLQFLEDAEFGRTWKYYGGLETLYSYGIQDVALSDDPEAFETARLALGAVLPDSHLNFLTNRLIPYFDLGGYYFVHAGVRPGLPLNRQVEADLYWIRDDFLQSKFDHGRVVVHGHTPVEHPEIRRNRIGIDTGAYITGHLTALVLEGRGQRFLSTSLHPVR
ncbi:MAG: serine/threonine protein phosphatase 1 [Parvibaculaceae bacterium]|jgi:serine/threonine protein phosphatase 1